VLQAYWAQLLLAGSAVKVAEPRGRCVLWVGPDMLHSIQQLQYLALGFTSQVSFCKYVQPVCCC
jgi:hypothetical protein